MVGKKYPPFLEVREQMEPFVSRPGFHTLINVLYIASSRDVPGEKMFTLPSFVFVKRDEDLRLT